jgi:Transposase, Mutator family
MAGHRWRSGTVLAVLLGYPAQIRCAPKVPVEHPRSRPPTGRCSTLTGEPPGERSIAVARTPPQTFSATVGRRFPAAVACLDDDLASLFVHCASRRAPQAAPSRHLIERTFGEIRRRVKVIGRRPGERSCPSLVWAVPDRASRGWRGVIMTPASVRQL